MSPTLLPDPTQLDLLCLTGTDMRVTINVCPKAAEGRCPLCGRRSARIHSRYVRTLADLPWSSVAVRIRLHVRRFFCPNDTCQRRIFTERLPGIVEPYARRTDRLTLWVTHVAFAVGGEPGSRLLRRGCAPISGDTLLGCIRSFQMPDAEAATILSVDDFALRRGRTYGTIVVDLQRHRVIDLLPDRSADGFARWLRDHRGAEVISRDRGGEYARGANEVAPEAIQVADRFHLLRNAGDVTRRILQRHASIVQRLSAPGPPRLELSRRRLDRAASKHHTRETMRKRYEQIHALAAAGMSKAAIARQLDLNWQTVHNHLALTAPPERRPTGRQGSAIAPYEGYILHRWTQGCRNGKQLWREMREQGYRGAYENVARIMTYFRRQQRRGCGVPSAPIGLTPRQAAGLLLLRSENRTADEQHTVDQLRALHPNIQGAVTLLERFATVLRESPREHPDERLEPWMAEAESFDLPEFVAFAAKLRQDLPAVLAALSLPWSQGQTEGQITKLKLLKRGMYGRAKLDLLKQRLLYTASAA